MKRLILVAMMAMALAVAPKAADAAIIIDFGSSIPGGTITLSGGHVTATAIPVPNLTALNTPAFGAFGFWSTTGTATDANGGGAYASLSFDTAANTISVVGAVPGLGLASQTLLSGSFTSFSVTPGIQPGSILFQGTGPDAKSRELLTALGMLPNTPFEFYGFSFMAVLGQNDYYSAYSTDISNTAVPEPGTMMLLGAGLLGLAAAARRRMRKA